MLSIRRVVGDSMLPTLRPGTVVIALRWRRVRQGDVVIIRHEGIDKIKRVHKLRPGSVYVLGDNAAASTDSRHHGWLPNNAVVGIVLLPRLRNSYTTTINEV